MPAPRAAGQIAAGITAGLEAETRRQERKEQLGLQREQLAGMERARLASAQRDVERLGLERQRIGLERQRIGAVRQDKEQKLMAKFRRQSVLAYLFNLQNQPGGRAQIPALLAAQGISMEDWAKHKRAAEQTINLGLHELWGALYNRRVAEADARAQDMAAAGVPEFQGYVPNSLEIIEGTADIKFDRTGRDPGFIPGAQSLTSMQIAQGTIKKLPGAPKEEFNRDAAISMFRSLGGNTAKLGKYDGGKFFPNADGNDFLAEVKVRMDRGESRAVAVKAEASERGLVLSGERRAVVTPETPEFEELTPEQRAQEAVGGALGGLRGPLR